MLFKFGPFALDASRRLLSSGSHIKPLSERLNQILMMLLESDGAAVSKDEFAERIWTNDTFNESNLAQHVSQLRKILQQHGGFGEFIATVAKTGYRFVPRVARFSDRDVAAHHLSSSAPREKRLKLIRDYCKAQSLLARRTNDSLRQAIALFERVLAVDSNFAPAWTFLARAHSLANYRAYSSTSQALPTANTAIAEALRLEPESFSAQCIFGSTRAANWDGAGAAQALGRALELNENSGMVYHHRAFLDQRMGQLEQALADIEAALLIEPSNLLFQCALGLILGRMGEFSKAIACFSSVLEDDPQFEDAIECRIASYIGIGRGEDALRDLDRLPPSNTNLARRVCAYAVSGDKTAAENALENLLTARKDGHVAPDFLAAAFLLLDRQEEALLALQQGIDNRETGVLVFRTWP
ncbi:MAG: winged helix-turn-helix domain-containing protein, partial [Candidatus Eremiobacteraeota bacterium]|nr:winged helix-turn-helix domain-containing protein [Candidatus Eremiobacteraeota bacterium]